MLNSQLWIEPLGNVVVVRVRGELTESLLKEIHERVIQLLRDTEYTRVLYDALEMESPDIDIALLQEKLNEQTKQLFADQSLRKAILVSNTRLGYLSRIAFGQFGEGDYRVFYNDLSHALQWLET
ncbi:STAS/SEC14 domain-containing protein [Massilia sp. YIM B02763]|uniref:STAS/SEC14 domain-containing protein n=1 Tax=Massilia sp. YIM B02763 TaxID=3050130 RepID=UPI0025B6789C|nr:STAS/SEC14 domain-containing protein [Massilia sp. YIM B02763]MDN4054206.1 STAS/SEC14 domain-containing protein [Massilia sp. YIM B02763]